MPGDHAPSQGGAIGAVSGVLIYGFTKGDLPPCSLPLPRSDPATRIYESSYRRGAALGRPFTQARDTSATRQATRPLAPFRFSHRNTTGIISALSLQVTPREGYAYGMRYACAGGVHRRHAHTADIGHRPPAGRRLAQRRAPPRRRPPRPKVARCLDARMFHVPHGLHGGLVCRLTSVCPREEGEDNQS